MTVGEAREAYAALRDRAASVVSSADARYVSHLWSSWDSVLATFPADLALPSWIEHTTQVIADPQLSADAKVQWLDAYPDGIVARLSEATA